MTNWENQIHNSVGNLATGESADLGYAYVERQNTQTYMVQTYGPLEEIKLDFNATIQRLIDVASQNHPPSS